ncbi:MAG: lysophospholipid acyltransferase family protein [Betaproteobacteria bacterium]
MSDGNGGGLAASLSGGGRVTPLPLRLYRVARTGVHLLEGVATTTLVFPLITPTARRKAIRGWSRRLLRMLNVDARLHGEPAVGGNVLIVANHVSWLDIFVLNAVSPVRFVAKAELSRWPVAGRLIRDVGTLFVERERRRDARRVNGHAAAALARGDVVAVFPEGTTTDGTALLPFKSSLLQPIVDARGRVQPMAIRYRAANGEPSRAPAYVGDDTFLASFWRVTGARSLMVDLHAPPALAAGGSHRRELARSAEAAIRTVLEAVPVATAPGTRAGRGGGSP